MNNTLHHLVLLLLLLPCTLLVYAITATNQAYPTLTEDCSVSGEDMPVPARREVYDNGRIFDISHKYTPELPSYGVKDGLGEYLSLGMSIKNGSDANVSVMKFSVHSGTHVDAPGHVFDHYYDAGFDVDALDLEFLNGN